ncbi:MAG: hypothetical protein WA919_25965 [Coleofasciculaceae cyanobacterium]
MNLGEQLVLVLEERLATIERPIIAIDGRGGAGKSTLARAIQSKYLGLVHVEFDAFHLPLAEVQDFEHFDITRILNQLIIPFQEEQPLISYQRYNWGYLQGRSDGLDEELVSIGPANGVILEGCGTFHPKLLPHFALKIWIDIPLEIARERGISRDIHEYGLDEANVHSLWSDWEVWQERLIRQNNPADYADIIVS